MPATDCLFNCLREVRLERFHQNFTERGLINCEQLSSLLVDDYSRFGVVSTDDRRHLFQLIHIIKSVQADGICCQHGAPTVTDANGNGPQQTKLSVPIPNPVQQKEELPDVTKNGIVRAQKLAAAVEDRSRNSTAAGQQFLKPVSKKQPPEKPGLRATEETKVFTKTAATVTDDCSGTPKFNCRKTLNFSDPDLYSDGPDSSCFLQQPAVSNTAAKPSLQSQNNNAIKTSAVAKPSGLRPPQVVLTNCISSPRAFVIPAESKPVQRQRSNRNHVSHAEPQISSNNHQTSYGVTWNDKSTEKSSFQNDDSLRRVYFSAPKTPLPGELEAYIEQIYHSNSYNYGVPGSNVHLVDKVLSVSVYI